MKSIKSRLLAGSLLLISVLAPQAPAFAQSADEILTRSRDRQDGKDVYSDLKLVLTDESGRPRTRDLMYLQKDYGTDQKLTLYFNGPADVRGVAFQSANYDEAKGKEDDQWLYLPAFRQVRRISAADKRGSFMGSEFTFVDMDRLRVSDYKQSVKGTETVLGRPCYVIERIPSSDSIISKTGYYKTVVWVDKESYVVLKQDYYDVKNVLFKTMTVKSFEKIQGIWTVLDAEAKDLISRKSSNLVYSNVKYDIGLGDTLFNQNVLKAGVSRANIPVLN
jgi:outer membrane lipoprotein-sorting protein